MAGVSESILSIAVSIVVNVFGENPVSKVKLDLATGLMRVEEGNLEFDGPVDPGRADEGIKFKLVLPLENPQLLLPPSSVEGRVDYTVSLELIGIEDYDGFKTVRRNADYVIEIGWRNSK